MPTIFERVSTALATLSPVIPYALAPYLSNAEFPDTFIVYQLIDSVPVIQADNVEVSRSKTIQVTIYSRAGLVNIPNVDAAMLAAGFMKSAERQIPKDEDHHALALDYVYYET
jgi:hypothetical protein